MSRTDQGYQRDLGVLLEHFLDQQQRQVERELSQHPTGAKGFQVEPKRWIVERTALKQGSPP